MKLNFLFPQAAIVSRLRNILRCAALFAAQAPALAATGDLDTTFGPNAASSVLSLALQADGKIVMGGGFGTVGGVTRRRLARLNGNGTLDSAFNPNVGGAFLWCTTVLADGRLIVGGEFTTIGGTARNYIARLNANGTVDPSFNPSANATVKCMALQADGRIVIGGDFTSVGGVTRNRIARLNADGTLDTGFNPNANGLVNNIIVQPDGKIFFGGGFTTVGGQARSRIARVNADGTLDPSFLTGFQNGVFCAALQPDGKILIGTSYTLEPGTGRRDCVFRLLANGALDTVFNPQVGVGSVVVYSIALQTDGKIVVGGTITGVGGVARSNIARLNLDGTLDEAFDPNVEGIVDGVALQGDGKLLIGGDITDVGDVGRSGVVRLLNDAAVQTLSVTGNNRLQWLRGGSVPETHAVTFDLSTDGGVSWSLLGVGTRIVGGWERTGVTLPASGSIRGRARVASGYLDGSSGLVEQIATFTLDTTTQPPTLTVPVSGSATRSPITVSYFLPEAALAGSVRLIFASGGENILLTVADSENGAGAHTITFSTANPIGPQIVAGSPLPDAVYIVGVRYRDALGNPVATSAPATNVTIDTTPPAGGTLTLTPASSSPPGAAMQATAGGWTDGRTPLTYQFLLDGAPLGAPATATTVSFMTPTQLGLHTVTLRIADSLGNSVEVSQIFSVNNPPVARAATLGAAGGGALSIAVAKLLTYASDLDGDALAIVAVNPVSARGGVVMLSNGLITYSPPAGYSGPDSFSYTLRDARGGTVTGLVNASVVAAAGGSLNVISITPTAAGFLLRFAGIPGYAYVLQFRNSLNDPWQTLVPPGPIAAGPTGLIEFEDRPSPRPPARFYRAAAP